MDAFLDEGGKGDEEKKALEEAKKQAGGEGEEGEEEAQEAEEKHNVIACDDLKGWL